MEKKSDLILSSNFTGFKYHQRIKSHIIKEYYYYKYFSLDSLVKNIPTFNKMDTWKRQCEKYTNMISQKQQDFWLLLKLFFD